MRNIADWWHAGRALALTAFIALAGCDRKPLATGKGDEVGKTEPIGLASTTPPAVGPGVPATKTARAEADKFLTALGAGKATVADLTDAFRAHLPEDASLFLGRFDRTKFVVAEETAYAGAIVLRGRADSPDRKDGFTIRLVQDTMTFKVDWLSRSDRMWLPAPPTTRYDDPDLAGAVDTTRNFLDTLLGGDLLQTQALMAPAWRKQIAAANADTKTGLDYDPSFLTLKMKFWRADVVGYSVRSATLAESKHAATVVAGLESGGAKVTWIVKAVQDKATRQWAIEDFVKQ